MPAPTAAHPVADGVFAFTGTEVNWVLVQEGSELTLIDAGWVGDTQAVEQSIRSLGRRPEDVRAVLLTHAHADHTGALNHLRNEYGVPLYMAAGELPNALGAKVESGGPLDVAKRLYRPRVARWAVEVIRAGGLRHSEPPDVVVFPPDRPLDMPGRPVPVATPGHTSGHTSFLLPSSGAVVTGDALITAHPTVSGVRPQLLPAWFAHDQHDVVASLDALHALDADVFVPGHGPPWLGPLATAVDEALARTHTRPRNRQAARVRGTRPES